MPPIQPKASLLKRNSPVPLYRQIANLLLQDIHANSDNVRHRSLPSETELTKRYKVSRVTIRHALKELERSGIIYREKGKGSFISRSRIKGVSGFGSFTAEVSLRGRQPGSRVLDQRLVDSLPLKMRTHFYLSDDRLADDKFVLLKRLRLIDGKPVAIEEAYLPYRAFAGLEAVYFGQNQSLFTVLAEQWGVEPVWAEALIESISAADPEATLLGLAPGAPLLVAWRISLTKTDEVVEYVKSVYNGSDFLFNIGRHRIET